MPPETTSPTPRPTSSLTIPLAIVLSACVIAAAIVYTGIANKGTQDNRAATAASQETQERVVEPVTENDHIRGNPNAPIVIIEYSDFDCPFCKVYHESMSKIITEFGESGKVAWVYRQLPLAQLHPNAPKIAEASECVASLGGNDAFWKFSDAVFGLRGQSEPTDMSKLATYAKDAGVDATAFETCLKNETFKGKIENDIKAGFAAGAKGTPYSIIRIGDAEQAFSGAQPYETMRQMIQSLIAQLEA